MPVNIHSRDSSDFSDSVVADDDEVSAGPIAIAVDMSETNSESAAPPAAADEPISP